jgi:hypothetical protein
MSTTITESVQVHAPEGIKDPHQYDYSNLKQ